jgi:hypothetical protein
MRLPFTVEQFFDVFRQYNEALWPTQWALLALGVIAVALALRPGSATSRGVNAALALLWLWSGSVYHLTFFSEINPAAAAFGMLFIAQGVLFFWLGVWKRRLTIGESSKVRWVLGGVIIAYALVAYPVLGYLLGHRFPAAPTFGVPCPTTILTLGFLVWMAPVPRLALFVPVIWAAIGTSAALQLGMLEDLGLPLAAVTAIGVAFGSRRARVTRSGATTVGRIKEAT